MAGPEKEGFNTGKLILAGTAAGGVAALLTWLISTARAAPPEGAVIFSPDEWTKDTLLGMLTALNEISGKLSTVSGKLDSQIDLLSAIAGEEVPGVPFKLEVTPISEVTISGMTSKDLYLSESPTKGAVIAIELVSDIKDIEYGLHLDDIVWSFNVSDMITHSIEFPHFPGAWLSRASAGTYVFMFSSGATSDVKYQTNLRLTAKATSANDVTLSGTLVSKVYD